jgi:hypothetical protein
VSHTTREPTGTESFDRVREHARVFAVARSRSFELLLGLLASGGPPSAKALESWQTARHEADRLWIELVTAKQPGP